MREENCVPQPLSHYNHVQIVEVGSELLFLAGQVGVRPDSSVPDEFSDQAILVWQHINSLLQSRGYSVADICKVTSYIVGEKNIPSYVDVHKKSLGDFKPPWTLLVVSALGDPKLKVEVEVIAAKQPKTVVR